MIILKIIEYFIVAFLTTIGIYILLLTIKAIIKNIKK